MQGKRLYAIIETQTCWYLKLRCHKQRITQIIHQMSSHPSFLSEQHALQQNKQPTKKTQKTFICLSEAFKEPNIVRTYMCCKT